MKPSLYVIAGPNGAGKTTSFENFLPKGVPYLNTDEILRDIRTKTGQNINIQEVANSEAVSIFYQKVNRREDFAIETNLSDNETYKSLSGVQQAGYDIKLFYFYVEDPQTCMERVKNRVKEGGHFVRPDIVKGRYEVSLNLLSHYRDMPDYLRVIDNSTPKGFKDLLGMRKGKINYVSPELPGRLKGLVSALEKGSINNPS